MVLANNENNLLSYYKKLKNLVFHNGGIIFFISIPDIDQIVKNLILTTAFIKGSFSY
ncbi:Uncharacterized protein dnm_002220 [Desulfonema magnum]|uniref:Uncharacterized protein n=1 Tax=Desulfonema magnum TaxID=45655 RepID=A0A975BFB3_9BACT|nr:Uncharacterized protein dnm_002220 [Desulfonema magnum]